MRSFFEQTSLFMRRVKGISPQGKGVHRLKRRVALAKFWVGVETHRLLWCWLGRRFGLVETGDKGATGGTGFGRRSLSKPLPYGTLDP